jgi:hypothetical protein
LSVLFAMALFLGAALLFVIEPMAGRRALPLFGGGSSVWTTCLLFFQGGLLAGYSYVHLATRRLGVRLQVQLQAALLVLALGALGVRLFRRDPSIMSLTTPGSYPTWRLIGHLLTSVGLPFFVLATLAPLLQRWYAVTGHRRAGDPYFLYALSNGGSLFGLIAYPLVIEPNLTLTEQERLWAIGYGILAALVLGCAVAVWRMRGTSGLDAGDAPDPSRRLDTGAWLRWVAFSFVPSSLLLGVTAALTTDVAPVPLLWVVPLALYLVTFILAFARRQFVPHGLMVRLLPPVVMALVPVIAFGLVQPFWIPLHLLAFFVAAMVCHQRLAGLRPETGALTAYYLAIALGGALGGMFNALVAPRVFDRMTEYPLGLFLACLCLPAPDGAPRRRPARDALVPLVMSILIAMLVRDLGGLAQSALGVLALILASGLTLLVTLSAGRRPLRFALGVAAVLLAGGLSEGVDGRVLFRERTFYGVLRVTEAVVGGEPFHRLFQGTTLHGQQCLAAGRRGEPLAYFDRSGPIGRVFEIIHDRSVANPPPLRVAVVGLGAGSLSAYARAGERWTFYEIDPAIVRIARDPAKFTFLEDSRAASMDVEVGDARLRLREAPEHTFDLIVLDAFSSDAIPTHLLTREALRLYREKLAVGGMIALHLSNRTIDLEPVVGQLARDAGVIARVRHDGHLTAAERRTGKSASLWAVLAAADFELGALSHDPRWHPARVDSGDRVWTDDWSSILGHLRLGRLLDAQPAMLLLQGPSEQAGAGVDRVDVGRRDPREPAQLDHGADQGVELQRPAVLHVLEHGRLVLADPLGPGDSPLERHPEVGAEFFADCLRLGHHGRRQGPTRRELADPGQSGVRQGADRVEAQVAPELQPDLGADILQHRRLEAGLLE